MSDKTEKYLGRYTLSPNEVTEGCVINPTILLIAFIPFLYKTIINSENKKDLSAYEIPPQYIAGLFFAHISFSLL